VVQVHHGASRSASSAPRTAFLLGASMLLVVTDLLELSPKLANTAIAYGRNRT